MVDQHDHLGVGPSVGAGRPRRRPPPRPWPPGRRPGRPRPVPAAPPFRAASKMRRRWGSSPARPSVVPRQCSWTALPVGPVAQRTLAVDAGVAGVVGLGRRPHPLAALPQPGEPLAAGRRQQAALGRRVSGRRRSDLTQLGRRQHPRPGRRLGVGQACQPLGRLQLGGRLADRQPGHAGQPPGRALVAGRHMRVATRRPAGRPAAWPRPSASPRARTAPPAAPPRVGQASLPSWCWPRRFLTDLCWQDRARTACLWRQAGRATASCPRSA